MIQVTDVRIEPNPAAAGGELEIEITIEESSRRFPFHSRRYNSHHIAEFIQFHLLDTYKMCIRDSS